MTPERERMFREQMHAPTKSLDVLMWQCATQEVLEALDAERAKVAALRSVLWQLQGQEGYAWSDLTMQMVGAALDTKEA